MFKIQTATLDGHQPPLLASSAVQSQPPEVSAPHFLFCLQKTALAKPHEEHYCKNVECSIVDALQKILYLNSIEKSLQESEKYFFLLNEI